MGFPYTFPFRFSTYAIDDGFHYGFWPTLYSKGWWALGWWDEPIQERRTMGYTVGN